MKKSMVGIMTMVAVLVASIVWYSCTKEPETGTIHGTVTDIAGGYISNANVKIRPSGETTLTGNDGTYEFKGLKVGQYSLSLSKPGYEDLDDDYVINLESGKSVRRDVQMRKKVASLRITDASGNDMDILDFGSEAADVSRLFNIHNENDIPIEWQIVTTAEWIKSVSATEGTLAVGGTKGIVVVIDRTKLQQGENTTTMHILSDNGNMQLTIKATRSDISTLEATSVNGNSAVLNGCINTTAAYSEKGFMYGTSHTLTEQVIVNGNSAGSFSTSITGLSGTQTYYFKAYCVINGEYLYGEEKSFGPYITSTFEFNGHTYMVAPDPHTSYSQYISWGAANSYCENLTLWGYSDWRLPTIEELLTMYQLREEIGGFINDTSWCTNNGVWHDYHSVYQSSTIGNGYYYHFFVKWNDGAYNTSYDIEYSGYCAGYAQQYAHVRPVRVDY